MKRVQLIKKRLVSQIMRASRFLLFSGVVFVWLNDQFLNQGYSSNFHISRKHMIKEVDVATHHYNA